MLLISRHTHITFNLALPYIALHYLPEITWQMGRGAFPSCLRQRVIGFSRILASGTVPVGTGDRNSLP